MHPLGPEPTQDAKSRTTSQLRVQTGFDQPIHFVNFFRRVGAKPQCQFMAVFDLVEVDACFRKVTEAGFQDLSCVNIGTPCRFLRSGVKMNRVKMLVLKKLCHFAYR